MVALSGIKHVFFDLDRTLWDFETNSKNELHALFSKHQLMQRGISLPDEFIKVYKQINEKCWEAYRLNQMSRKQLRSRRFKDTLSYFGIEDDALATKIGDDYIRNSPLRTLLLPNAIGALKHLSKNYNLHIITNGFEEVQHIKMRKSKLTPFFKSITTSEQAGVKKPHLQIFEKALDNGKANAQESVYIGDDFLVDIEGALNANFKAIYFNPHKKDTPEGDYHTIEGLKELTELL